MTIAEAIALRIRRGELPHLAVWIDGKRIAIAFKATPHKRMRLTDEEAAELAGLPQRKPAGRVKSSKAERKVG